MMKDNKLHPKQLHFKQSNVCNKYNKLIYNKIISIFLIFLIVFSPLSLAQGESGEPGEPGQGITKGESSYQEFENNPTLEGFSSLSPENKLKFYADNPRRVGLYPQIDSVYFSNTNFIGKNPPAEDLFFSGDYNGGNSKTNFEQHREYGEGYLRQKFKATYSLEKLAGDFVFDLAQKLLKNNGKTLFLAQYENDLQIKKITAIAEGFRIEKVGEEDSAEDITISGSAELGIEYQDGTFFFTAEDGRKQSFGLMGTVGFKFEQDGSLTVDGRVSGRTMVNGKFVLFNNHLGTLQLRSNGDLEADNAEVITADFYGDGKFSKIGNKVVAQDHGYRNRGNIDHEGKTIIIDRRTDVGVKTQGQTGSNKVEIFIDQSGENSEVQRTDEPPNAEQIREQARTVLPPQGDLGEDAKVWIKRDPQTQEVFVTAKGKVDVGFYSVGREGGAVLSEYEPHFTGKNGISEFDMRKAVDTVINVRGQAEYSDQQYQQLQTGEDGASVKINRLSINLQDAVSADCFSNVANSCLVGSTALTLKKRIVTVTEGLTNMVYTADETDSFDVSLKVTDEGLGYEYSLRNLGNIAQSQTEGKSIIYGRDLIMTARCGGLNCNFLLGREQDTGSVQGYYEQFDPLTNAAVKTVSINLGLSNFIGGEVILTSEKNKENMDRLTEMILTKNYGRINELEFDPDPQLRSFIYDTYGLDLNLVENEKYLNRIGQAIKKRQEFDSFSTQLAEKGINLDERGQPVTADDAKKISRLVKTQTAAFYLYTAAISALSQAQIAEAEAMRSSCEEGLPCLVSDKEFKEIKKDAHEQIKNMQNMRSFVAEKIRARKEKQETLASLSRALGREATETDLQTLIERNKAMEQGLPPAGGQEALAKVETLGQEKLVLDNYLVELTYELQSLQQKIAVYETQEKAGHKELQVSVEGMKQAEAKMIKRRNGLIESLAAIETSLAQVALRFQRGTDAVITARPDWAAKIAAAAGDYGFALQLNEEVKLFNPELASENEEMFKLMLEGRQEELASVAQSGESQSRRELILMLLAADNLGAAASVAREIDPLASMDAQADDDFAQEQIWKKTLSQLEKEAEERTGMVFDRAGASIEEYEGVGGALTYASRVLSPVNLKQMLGIFGDEVFGGEVEDVTVVEAHQEADRRALKQLGQRSDASSSLLALMNMYRNQGLTPREAMQRIYDNDHNALFEGKSEEQKRAVKSIIELFNEHGKHDELFTRYAKQLDGRTLDPEDLATRMLAEAQAKIDYHRGDNYVAEEDLARINYFFPKTQAAMIARQRIANLDYVDDYVPWNSLSDRSLEEYRDLAVESATVLDLIPLVGIASKLTKIKSLFNAAKAAGQAGRAAVASRGVLSTAEQLSKVGTKAGWWNNKIYLGSNARALEKEARVLRGELSAAKRTGDVQRANQVLGELEKVNRAQDYLGLTGSPLGRLWSGTLGREITSGTKGTALATQRAAVKELAGEIAQRGVRNINPATAAAVKAANEAVEAATLGSRASAAMKQVLGQRKPVDPVLAAQIDDLTAAGARVRTSPGCADCPVKFDAVPAKFKPTAAKVEQELAGVTQGQVAKAEEGIAAAEKEMMTGDLAAGAKVADDAGRQARGGVNDVLPNVNDRLVTPPPPNRPLAEIEPRRIPDPDLETELRVSFNQQPVLLGKTDEFVLPPTTPPAGDPLVSALVDQGRNIVPLEGRPVLPTTVEGQFDHAVSAGSNIPVIKTPPERLLVTTEETRKAITAVEPGDFNSFYDLYNKKNAPPLPDQEINRFDASMALVKTLGEEKVYPDFGFIQSGWVGITSREPLTKGSRVRVYFNAKDAESSQQIMGIVGRELSDKGIKFRMKRADRNPMFSGRSDNTVLYVDPGDFGEVQKIVQEINPGLLDSEVPMFTKEISPGISWGESPPGKKSFGEVRSNALVEIHRRTGGKITPDFDEVAREVFREKGIDPDKPWLNLESKVDTPSPAAVPEGTVPVNDDVLNPSTIVPCAIAGLAGSLGDCAVNLNPEIEFAFEPEIKRATEKAIETPVPLPAVKVEKGVFEVADAEIVTSTGKVEIVKGANYVYDNGWYRKRFLVKKPFPEDAPWEHLLAIESQRSGISLTSAPKVAPSTIANVVSEDVQAAIRQRYSGNPASVREVVDDKVLEGIGIHPSLDARPREVREFMLENGFTGNRILPKRDPEGVIVGQKELPEGIYPTLDDLELRTATRWEKRVKVRNPDGTTSWEKRWVYVKPVYDDAVPSGALGLTDTGNRQLTGQSLQQQMFGEVPESRLLDASAVSITGKTEPVKIIVQPAVELWTVPEGLRHLDPKWDASEIRIEFEDGLRAKKTELEGRFKSASGEIERYNLQKEIKKIDDQISAVRQDAFDQSVFSAVFQATDNELNYVRGADGNWQVRQLDLELTHQPQYGALYDTTDPKMRSSFLIEGGWPPSNDVVHGAFKRGDLTPAEFNQRMSNTQKKLGRINWDKYEQGLVQQGKSTEEALRWRQYYESRVQNADDYMKQLITADGHVIVAPDGSLIQPHYKLDAEGFEVPDFDADWAEIQGRRPREGAVTVSIDSSKLEELQSKYTPQPTIDDTFGVNGCLIGSSIYGLAACPEYHSTGGFFRQKTGYNIEDPSFQGVKYVEVISKDGTVVEGTLLGVDRNSIWLLDAAGNKHRLLRRSMKVNKYSAKKGTYVAVKDWNGKSIRGRLVSEDDDYLVFDYGPLNRPLGETDTVMFLPKKGLDLSSFHAPKVKERAGTMLEIEDSSGKNWIGEFISEDPLFIKMKDPSGNEFTIRKDLVEVSEVRRIEYSPLEVETARLFSALPSHWESKSAITTSKKWVQEDLSELTINKYNLPNARVTFKGGASIEGTLLDQTTEYLKIRLDTGVEVDFAKKALDPRIYVRRAVTYDSSLRQWAEAQGRIYENFRASQLPNGKTYTYIVLEDGRMVFGESNTALEVGTKHLSLANGRPVKAAGEIKILPDGSYQWNLQSGTYTRKLTRTDPGKGSYHVPEAELRNRMDAIFKRDFKETEGIKKTEGTFTSDSFISDTVSKEEVLSLCSQQQFVNSLSSGICGKSALKQHGPQLSSDPLLNPCAIAGLAAGCDLSPVERIKAPAGHQGYRVGTNTYFYDTDNQNWILEAKTTGWFSKRLVGGTELSKSPVDKIPLEDLIKVEGSRLTEAGEIGEVSLKKGASLNDAGYYADNVDDGVKEAIRRSYVENPAHTTDVVDEEVLIGLGLKERVEARAVPSPAATVEAAPSIVKIEPGIPPVQVEELRELLNVAGDPDWDTVVDAALAKKPGQKLDVDYSYFNLVENSYYLDEGAEGVVLTAPPSFSARYPSENGVLIKVFKRTSPLGVSFEEQAAIMNHLASKGIAPSVFETNPNFMIVERLPGRTLSGFSETQIGKYQKQLEDVIDELAKTGYAIDDPLLSNFMLTPEGKIKIIDVGTAAPMPPNRARRFMRNRLADILEETYYKRYNNIRNFDPQEFFPEEPIPLTSTTTGVSVSPDLINTNPAAAVINE